MLFKTRVTKCLVVVVVVEDWFIGVIFKGLVYVPIEYMYVVLQTMICAF